MLDYYKPTLVSLFRQLQELRSSPANAQLCLEIQEVLIKKITYVEGRIRKCKVLRNVAKRNLRKPRDNRLTRDEANDLKGIINDLNYQVEEYQYLLYILRCVGDGIAHIYINKWDIKPMAFKESPGFISRKKGARLERKTLRESIKRLNVPVILNDLTNCLRYGDITVPNDGFFMLLEMKSGKSKVLDTRGEKQLKKAEEITTYLYTDYASNLYESDHEVFRVALQRKERFRTKQLNRLIRATRDGEIRTKKVEEGLMYIVDRAFEGDRTSLASALTRGNFSSETTAAILSPKSFHHAYFPLTLSIEDPDALFDLFNRTMLLVIFVDLKVLRMKLLERGIKVELLTDDEDWFMRLKSATPEDVNDGAHISRHFFGRLYAEFWSFKWLIGEIVHRQERLADIHERTEALRQMAKSQKTTDRARGASNPAKPRR